MKKIKLFSLTLLMSFPLYADFYSNDWSDDMSDTKVIERYTSIYKGFDNRFGFRCDISPNEKDFMLTFNSRNSIATPNSSVQVKVRVDKGKVYDLEGRLYSNSYKSGTIKDYPDELLDEIKNGEKILINIYSYRELEFQNSFSLKGSLEAVSETAGPCEHLLKLSDSDLNEIKKLEVERDKEILKIKSEYDSKISLIKNKKK